MYKTTVYMCFKNAETVVQFQPSQNCHLLQVIHNMP